MNSSLETAITHFVPKKTLCDFFLESEMKNKISRSLVMDSTLPIFSSQTTDIIPKKKFKISLRMIEKYNTKKVWALTFDEKTLQHLERNYHKLKVPKFIDRFINIDESFCDVELYKKYPQISKWSEDHTFLLQLNSPRLMPEMKKLLSEPEKMKTLESGFSLVGYYYHPRLVENFQYLNSQNLPSISSQKISYSTLTYEEIENENTPYLVSPLDLNKSHIQYLGNIKTMIHKHLKSTFKVTSEDVVHIYFHFPYALETTSLHIHVRVNQAHLKLEKTRMYYLDDVLIALNNNQSFATLIEKRTAECGGYIYMDAQLYKNISTCDSEDILNNINHYQPYNLIEALDGIQKIPCKLTDNPFYKEFPSERLIT